MKLNDIKAFGKRAYYAGKTLVVAHKSEIKLIGGIALSAFGTYKAFKAGQKVAEDGVIDEYREEIKKIDEEVEDKKERGKRKLKAVGKLVKEVAKRSVVAVASEGIGMALVVSSHKDMEAENAMLMSSLVAAAAKNKEYEKRLYERDGEFFPEGVSEITDVESGEKMNVIDFSKFSSPSSIVWSKENSSDFIEDEFYINSRIQEINKVGSIMLDGQGYVWRSVVYDGLHVGIPADGQIDGYLKGNGNPDPEKWVEPGVKTTDCVNVTWEKAYYFDENNERHMAAVVFFNDEPAPIIDRYEKYALNLKR